MKNNILVGRHCVLTNTEHTRWENQCSATSEGEKKKKRLCQISSVFDLELFTDEKKA